MSLTPLGPAPPPHLATDGSETIPSNELHTLAGHDGTVLALRFNPRGTYCLSCGKDRTVRLWNPLSGRHIKTYVGHGYDVRDVACHEDNSKFASCGGDRQVFLWDVASGRIIRKLKGHDAAINSIVYGGDDSVLVTGGYDRAVKVWDCRSRAYEAVQVMKDAADSVTHVAVSPRAEIFAGSVDGCVRRYDVRMGRLFTDALFASVTCVSLSHDNAMYSATCMDSTVRLLDRAEGDLLQSYKGHKHSSTKIEACFMPDDTFVIGASEDGRICCWDMVSGELKKSFQAHSDAVTGLALQQEGKLLCTASVDGLIKVWLAG